MHDRTTEPNALKVSAWNPLTSPTVVSSDPITETRLLAEFPNRPSAPGGLEPFEVCPSQKRLFSPLRLRFPLIRSTRIGWNLDERSRAEAIQKQHEVLLQELRLAEQVQRSMLPRTLPKLEGVSFGASLRPSKHLAGDFYNVVRLDRDRVAIYIGDVMGHGPAAALLAVFAMQGMKLKRIEGSNYEIIGPAEVLANLSRDLIRADFPGSPFVTMIYGVFDVSQTRLTFCGGGHPPGLVLRPGQPSIHLQARGPLMGVIDLPFEQEEVALSSGDRVVFYSDGVESIHWGECGQGVKGLSQCLNIRDGRTPQEMVDSVMALAEHREAPADDLTVVMFEVGTRS